MADFSSDYATDLLGTVHWGDLKMVAGDLQLTSDANPLGTNDVLQFIIQRLRTFLGEFFLDNSIGVPWYQQIIGHSGANSTTDAVIQNTILSTPGVQALTDYSSAYNGATRVLSVTFACQTSAGQVSYSGAVSPNTEANQ